MANEFKVRKGLVINGSGSALLEAQGSVGQLNTITDSLSGSLFSINDISGIPVLEAFSDATVKIGAFGVEAIKVSGSFATTTGSLRGTASYATNALSASNALSSSYALSSSFAINATTASFLAGAIPTFPFTGPAKIIGNLDVTGSVSISITTSSLSGPLTAWTVGGALITARAGLAGAGAQNAALGFGGGTAPSITTCTEAYNGTSWSAGGAMSVARYYLGGAGAQNAALGFGGRTPVIQFSTCTEAYNGTSWSAGGAMIILRNSLAGAGTQNAALGFGGYRGAPTQGIAMGLSCMA